MGDVAKWVDTAAARRATRDADHRTPRRDQIVVAAAEAIELHGLPTGTAQIAERAGVARPHVYRHFSSKEDLDNEVGKYAGNLLLQQVRPTMVRTGTPIQIITGVVSACVSWAADNPNLYRFMAARQQTKATHRARLGRTRFLGEIVDASTAYLRARNLDTEVPDGVLAGLMGMVDASIIWWLDHEDEQQEQVVERLSRQVWLILGSMLADLGLPIDDDTVLALP